MLLAAALALVAVQDPAPARFPDFPAQDALHYAIRLRVDLESQRLTADVDYTFRAVEPLEALRLHSTAPEDAEAYTLRFTAADGAELSATRDDDLLRIALPAAVPAGARVALHARLEGQPPDGFYFAETRHGAPVAYTDHYSIRARGWLPCEDHPADRARWSLRIDYAEGLEASGFGQPVDLPDSAEPEGREVRMFVSEAEVAPYMFSVVVGSFARVAESGDPLLLPHFVYPEDVATARDALVHHAAWLRIMTDTFGAYPYAKYTTVQCPTRWGGFEAPGNVLLSETLFERPGGGVGTLAHELVHMWFGDSVGYARWREVWLSEGFASYFGPWLHARVGGPDLKTSMARQRARWLQSFEGRTKSVRDDSFPHPDQALNSNTYPKGAWVLHMLRGELGDETFFAALRRYFQQCRGSSVLTADLVHHVEAVADRDLDWFFSQWLDRVGCPELAFARVDEGLAIEQRQRGAPYRFRLRLRWTDTAGDHDEVVEIDAARTVVPMQGEARDIEIDPEGELLFRPVR